MNQLMSLTVLSLNVFSVMQLAVTNSSVVINNKDQKLGQRKLLDQLAILLASKIVLKVVRWIFL